MDRAGLLEMIAGKTRSNTAAAILSNTKDLEEAYAQAMEAEGSAYEENEKYLDSIQGRIDLFNNSIQTMWNNTLDSGVIKWVVDLGTKFVELADSVGIVKLALAGLITYVTTKFFNVDFGQIFSGLTTKGINKIFGKEVISGVQTTKTNIDQLKTSIEAAKQAYMDNPNEGTKAALLNAEENLATYERLQKEGFQASNSKLGYFGSEIQKIKDYKKELKDLDSAIPAAEQKLQAAKDELGAVWSQGEFGDIDIDEIDKCSDAVKEAQDEVTTLKNRQLELRNTGSGAFQLLADGANKLSKQIQSAVSSMLVMYAISKLIQGIDYIFDKAIETYEESHQSFEDLNAELSNTESELKDLESQLKDVNDQIEEIKSNAPLTFTDQEELSRLKAQSEELQRQIDLTNTLKEQQQRGVNDSAIKTANKYAKTGVKTGKTTGENVASKAGTGAGVGAGLGVATGVGGAIISAAGWGTTLGSWAGPVGMLIGAAVGAIAGGIVGAVWGGVESALDEKVGESLDNMKAKYDELQNKYAEARTKYQDDPTEKTKKKFEEAQEALYSYEADMASYLSEMDAYYSSIDLSVYDLVEDADKIATLRKEINEFYDTQDKWAIQSGGQDAKYNAITRIFGENAEQELQNIDQKIKSAISSGKQVDFHKMFNDEGLAETKQRLADLGISITDLKYYYLDWKETEEEVTGSTYESVKSVSTLSDGIDALKSAFNEFNEEGLVTADTLVSLYDTFGSLGDAWEDYVGIMATGAATTQQAKKATEELLEAFMTSKLQQGPITDLKDYIALIAQLQKLGVTNAKEYVDALQKTSMISSIGKSVVNDKNEEGKTKDQLIQQYTQQYEQQYGITLSDEERLLIEKAITVEKKKQAALTAQTKENEYNEAIRAKEEAQEALDDFYREADRRAKEAGYESASDATLHNASIVLDKWEMDDGSLVGYYDAEKMLSDKVDGIKIPAKVDASNAEQEAKDAETEYQKYLDELGLSVDINFDDFDSEIDKIQSAYDTLNDVVSEYNTNGYLTLDNLQAFLSLEPEYLACLQMENGQLSINKAALEALIQAKLAEAKATVVQSTMKQLDALAAREEADAINESNVASINAIGGLGAYADALSTVSQEAIVAAGSVAAFNAAVQGAQANKLVNQSEIDAILSNMDTQLKMIDSVSTNLATNFDSIVSPDSGSNSADDALEKLREKYERQIKNLENQQTYLQNEIDRLEAEKKPVSKSYYEEQIKLEEKKLDLYKQEREALLKLDMTDEVADALWEVEHAIQESTMRMVEFRQSIIDLYKTAFDNLMTAYDNKDDFLSDQQNYIDKYLELMELQGDVAPVAAYQEQIAIENEKMADNIAELETLRAHLADAMTNGGLKEGSEEWVEMQDNIRATEAAILDNQIAIEEYTKKLKNIPVEAFNMVRDVFSFKDDFFTTQQDYIEGYADLLEAQGIDVPKELYDKLIEIEQEKRESNVADLVDARQGLVDIEASGFTAADEEWQDAYKKITDLEKKIQDSDIAMAQWEKTIREIDFEKFERFISRLDDLKSEIDHLRGLFDGDDVAFEDGTWTKEGITSLGLLYQKMQVAQEISEEYAQEIKELNATYAEGSMSEQEYYEQLQELKEGQWDAIELYEDSKDAIIDMEEARIDMIEEGIDKEIEAYQELIDLKKEELDAERDLYEFKKDVEKQTKDIATLQRRIAALSGSDSASDIAERRRLEAELYEAQEGLDSTYYSHAKDAQSSALDDELEAYQDSKEKYLEMLREALEETETIINEKIQEVLLNADVVMGEINTAAGEYGISLSASLTQPWKDASDVALAFKNGLDENLPLLINEDGVITLFSKDAKEKLNSVFTTAGSAAQLFRTSVNTVISNIKNIVENATSPLTANLKFPWENLTRDDGPISTFSQNAKNAISSAVVQAQGKAETMKNSLTTPWKEGSLAANTFSNDVKNALNKAVSDAKAAAAAISAANKAIVPSYVGSGNNSGGSGTNNTSGKTALGTGSKESPKQMHAVSALRGGATYYTTHEGKSTANKVKTVDGKQYLWVDTMQCYFLLSNGTHIKDVGLKGRNFGYYFPADTKYYRYYAKGTTGTKKDEWAITDEPWLGDELTMYATKDGTLSYMRAGSTVIPADLTKELISLGEVGLDGLMSMPKVDSGISLINNVVNKPEFKIDVENFLRCDNVSQDTLPELKKFVNEQMNSLIKQLNYGLKKAGAH